MVKWERVMRDDGLSLADLAKGQTTSTTVPRSRSIVILEVERGRACVIDGYVRGHFRQLVGYLRRGRVVSQYQPTCH